MPQGLGGEGEVRGPGQELAVLAVQAPVTECLAGACRFREGRAPETQGPRDVPGCGFPHSGLHCIRGSKKP